MNMNEPKQDRPAATDRADANDRLATKDQTEATERAEATPAVGDRKETRPDAAAQDETVVDPDTRLRDVLIGPAAGRRLE
jgi:hypothetical protein